jgi:predicted nucleotidyltransferase
VAEPVPQLFLKTLAALTRWLEDARAPAMIIGGVAASILGRPRATRDIDALVAVSEDHWAALLATAVDHGMAPRVADPLAFMRRTRVLLLRHEESGVDIDIILGRLPFEEEAISRAEWHDLGGARVRLPQVEDLLIMKAIAQRPQDLRDIEGLLDVHPGADIERVHRWVREFATATAMPDLLKGLEQLLEQRSSRPRR